MDPAPPARPCVVETVRIVTQPPPAPTNDVECTVCWETKPAASQPPPCSRCKKTVCSTCAVEMLTPTLYSTPDESTSCISSVCPTCRLDRVWAFPEDLREGRVNAVKTLLAYTRPDHVLVLKKLFMVHFPCMSVGCRHRFVCPGSSVHCLTEWPSRPAPRTL